MAIVLPRHNRISVEAWLQRVVGDIRLVPDEGVLAEPVSQLGAYFQGKRRSFDLELDLRGTAFQRGVWATVAAVPYGQTRTYADIARTVGKPAAVRAVGAANGANPMPIVIPCHRVIGSSGALTGYGGGLDVKERLLALEATWRGASPPG